VAEARRTGDRDALIATLETATIVMTDPYEVLALADELDEASIASGDAWRSMWATANRTRAMFELGDLAAAREAARQHRERAMTFRFLLFRFQSAVFEAMLASAEGRFDDAERAIEEAHRVGSDDPTLPSSGIHGLQMFLLRREQGRLDEMRPTLQVLRTLANRQSVWGPGLSLAYAELGLLDDAREIVHELAVDEFAAVPRDSLWPVALALLAEASLILADRSVVDPLLAALEPYGGRTLTAGFSACAGPADRLRAGLTELAGEHDRADQLAEEALDFARASGSPVWQARVEQTRSVMLRGRGETAAADAHAARALALAAPIGMGAITGLTVVAVTTAPDVALSDRDDLPDGLTVREVEVLALVAAGLSNRDIATQLFISPNTAANHVRSILQKIGAANRTEAAGYAIRNNLS
jgi:ATP/maltotriose-dependent transcriptional regulator MalT